MVVDGIASHMVVHRTKKDLADEERNQPKN